MTRPDLTAVTELRDWLRNNATEINPNHCDGCRKEQATFKRRADAFDALLAERAALVAQREPLAEGRDHLTVTGKFQSDKYPWCAAGFVPLKVTDLHAQHALLSYAYMHEKIDAQFSHDLREAVAIARKAAAPQPKGPDDE